MLASNKKRINDRIEEIRKKLDALLNAEGSICEPEIIRLSEKLDMLILKFYSTSSEEASAKPSASPKGGGPDGQKK